MIARLTPILAITFIDILGFSILLPLMPYFVQHFSADKVVVGALFSTFALCGLIAGPVWGNVSDRIGRKMVLIVSQIGATIGWTLLAFAPSIAVVFVARIIEGFSGGNISVTQAYVSDLVEPDQRGRAFAYIGATFSAGLIFGPAAGGWLYAHYGFTTALLLAAGLQAVTLVATIFGLPESRGKTDEQPASMRDIVTSLADPSIAPVMWQKLVFSLGLYGWFSVFILVLQLQLGFTAEQSSYFFAAFGVVSVIAQLGVVGRVTDAIGPRRASNLGFVATACGFAIVPFTHNLGMAAVMVALFSLGLALVNASLPALISNAAPENQRGTILGVASSLESVSGVFMPIVATAVLQFYGVVPTVAITVLFTLAALAMGVAQMRRESPVAQPIL